MKADLPYVRIRCPHCSRLLAEASPGSALRVKCGRCKAVVEWPSLARPGHGEAGELVN